MHMYLSVYVVKNINKFRNDDIENFCRQNKKWMITKVDDNQLRKICIENSDTRNAKDIFMLFMDVI